MRKLLLSSLLMFAAGSLMAASQNLIIAHVAITNAPLGNTNTIAFSAITRTWTNSVSSSPGTLIQETNSIPYSATNLWLQLNSYPANAFQIYTNGPASNAVHIVGKIGEVLTVTVSAGWAVVTYETNVITDRFFVTVPHNFDNSTNRGIIASGVVEHINNNATNSFATNAIALSNYMTLRTLQTVTGPKIFTGINNFTGTNTFTNSAWNGGTIAGVTSFSGVLNKMTNGYWTNGIAETLTVTNLSVPGTGQDSIKIGGGGTDATALYGFAVGYATLATGERDTLVGNNNETIVGGRAVILGSGNEIGATNATIIGSGNVIAAGHQSTTIIGRSITSTASNQFILGDSSQKVIINGWLAAASSTNNTWTGINTLSGDLATPAYSFTTLGNGNNISVDFGTNHYIRLDGTLSAAASLCGIVADSRNGLQYLLENNTGYDVVLAQNTIDPVPANRIVTFSGSDVTLPHKAFASIIYDLAEGRWNIDWLYPATALATNAVVLSDGVATNLTVYQFPTNKVGLTVVGFANAESNLFQVVNSSGNPRLGVSSNAIPFLMRGTGSANDVWTLTNATTGEGKWAAASGGSAINFTNTATYASNTTTIPAIIQPLTGTSVPWFQVNNTNGVAGFGWEWWTNYTYLTNIDSANWSRLAQGWDNAKKMYFLRSESLGSGTNAPMMIQTTATNVVFATNGTANFYGHLLFPADNTFDIGANSATRPRNVYAAASVICSQVQVGDAGYFAWANRGFILANANGVFQFANGAVNNFDRLQFGRTTIDGVSLSPTNAGLDLVSATRVFTSSNHFRAGGQIISSNALIAAPAIGFNTGDALQAYQTNGVLALRVSAVNGDTIANTNAYVGGKLIVTNATDLKGVAYIAGSTNVGGTVDTTDATATVLYSFQPQDSATYTVETRVAADNSTDGGNGAGYKRIATFRVTTLGAVTQISTTTAVATHEDDGAWDCTIDTSGGLIRVLVTGAAATTIRWRHTTEISAAFYD